MTTWSVAHGLVGSRTGKGSVSCGLCRRQIPNGDPIQVIHFDGVKKDRIRCIECAKEAGFSVDQVQVDAARLAIERRELEAAAPEPERQPRLEPRRDVMSPLADAAGALFDLGPPTWPTDH